MIKYSILLFLFFLPILVLAGPDEELISSAQNGDLVGVKAALRNGAKLDAEDELGRTALMLAGRLGNLDIFEILLKAGAQGPITRQMVKTWREARDPTLDFHQRYQARFQMEITARDYPQRARSANLTSVNACFTVLVGVDGKILDVRIRKIESRRNLHKPYARDFARAARHIVMKKTRLVSKPYKTSGVYNVPFVWNSRIEFSQGKTAK